ncbi:MAG: right-handed parallel beta-helix repeat-containing protein [Dehalococcoidia bacterium]|jgi:hypothetical protein
MPSRTAEYIDAQKQQADALARAQASGAAAGQTAAIQSTPPGYITGFKTVLTPELKIDIWPGVANVAGQRVELKETYTLRPEDETIARLSKAWWYLYIDRSGVIHGDIIQPEFKPDWMGNYHKNQPWRNIGRYFVCDDHLCYYAASWQQASEQTVYVAPSTFGGIASYYCPGVDDQIIINAAIKYLHEAYDGGVTHLLPGVYYINPNEYIRSSYGNTELVGEGKSTVIKATSGGSRLIYFFSQTEGVVAIRNLSLHSDYRLNFAAYIGSCNNARVENISVSGLMTTAIQLYYSTGTCKENIIDTNGNSGIEITEYGYWIIDKNDIKVTGNTSSVYGISYTGNSNSVVGTIISNNRIHDLTPPTGNDGIGIYVADYAYNTKVCNNVIDTITSDATAYGIYWYATSASVNCSCDTNVVTNSSDYGIYVESGVDNVKISDNCCFNNGSDTGIANTNRHNFYDGGTDTQCSG